MTWRVMPAMSEGSHRWMVRSKWALAFVRYSREYVADAVGLAWPQQAEGARSDRQIQEDYNSLQAKIPPEFWADLKQEGLIEANAALPAAPV
jgi:hypothetical protein